MSLRDTPWSSGSNGDQGRKSRRRVRRAYGGLVIGLVALSVSVSACSGGDQDKPSASATISTSHSTPPATSPPPTASASPSTTPSQKPVAEETVSDYTGWVLQKAAANARSHHVKSVTYADASDLRRSVVHTYNWKVCSQRPSAGVYSTATKLVFKIVEANESCTHPPRASSGNASSSGGSSSSGAADTSSGGSTGGGSTKAEPCSIRSNAGNCYHAGQFCRNADVGATTTDAAGRAITCSYEAGANRWHY